MSKAAKAKPAAAPAGDDAEAKPAKGGKKKLLLMAVPLLLAAVGAGLWFGGILPPLLGMASHDAAKSKSAADVVKPPTFVELPEIIANLNSRKPSYVKVTIKLQLAKAEDEPAVKAVMPRLLDLFQTYLREMRPDELQGSEGSYRLREEMIDRANVATAPAQIVDVLFTEMLVQ